MPHGGGHVGGGGFHGGGFHGGGFHHHGGGFHHHRFGHHHHHHHRPYGGGWWWWGGPGYYYGSPGYYAYRRVWSCACFWIWMVVALVIIAISVGVTVGPSGSSNENDYTPGATRLIPIDSTFCSGVSLSGSSSVLRATLYSLSSPPALTNWNNFTLQETASVSFHGHAYYQFYMRKGSAANGTSCIPSSSRVSSLQLLIIKGKSNFDSWVNRPSTSKAVDFYTINQRCPTTDSFTLSVTADDYYFFVYYNSASNSGSVVVDYQFYRKEYSVESSAVIHSCLYLAGISCDIPTSAGATYLLFVDGQSSALNTGDFSVDCIANGGIIAAIVIIPLLVLALVVGVSIAVLCYCRFKIAKKSATTTTTTPPIATDPMVQPAEPAVPPATVVNVTTTAPPAYNPNYPSGGTAPPPYTPPAPAPSYGSTATKPPGI